MTSLWFYVPSHHESVAVIKYSILCNDRARSFAFHFSVEKTRTETPKLNDRSRLQYVFVVNAVLACTVDIELNTR